MVEGYFESVGSQFDKKNYRSYMPVEGKRFSCTDQALKEPDLRQPSVETAPL